MKILIIFILVFSNIINAHAISLYNQGLSTEQKSIIAISAYTARGNLPQLKSELNAGLDAGLTINEIKEILVHLYAYCGFPRSIRGLQTFMEVIDERKAKGIIDETGADISPIKQEGSKYDRGKKILEELQKTPQSGTLTGYAAFAPIIDTFLKEHLFADIFERDVLTYAQRELVTISVLSAIGRAEPMLRSHLAICLNVGLTPEQLTEFTGIIQPIVGIEEAKAVKNIMDEVFDNHQPGTTMEQKTEPAFPKGELITNNNFTGKAWLQMHVTNDSTYNTSIGSVIFEPKARTNWHKHPGGQILLITDGQGYYQEKGKPAQLLHKGDVVRIPPNAEHWHGAASENSLTHIAISLNTDRGSVVWLQPVTDEEYNGL